MLCSPTVLPNIDRWKASTEVLLMSDVALAEVELFYGDSGFSMAMGTEEGFSYSVTNSRPIRQQQSIFRCPYGNRSNSLNLRSHVMWKRGVAFSACSLKVPHGWATTSGGLFLNTGLTIANGVLTHGRRNVFLHTRWLQSGINSSNTYFHSLEATDKHQAQIITVLNNRPTMYVIGLSNHRVKPYPIFIGCRF